MVIKYWDDENIFLVSKEDSEKVEFKSDDPKKEQFLKSIPYTIEWIKNTLSQLELSEDKEASLTKCLRSVNTTAGFCKLFNLNKLDHIFSLLSFIFTESRKEGTLKKYSLDYLVKLLLSKAEIIANDYLVQKFSTEDLTGVIEECKLYCKPILTKKKSQTFSEFQSHSTIHKIENSNNFSEENKEENKIEHIEEDTTEEEFINEDPEELNIPSDKIGLISDFYEESYDNLVKFGNELLDLENQPDNIDIINSLFRSMHTLKGGARLIKIQKMETLSHVCEEVLDDIRKGKRKVTTGLIDHLMEVKKRLSSIIDEVASRGPITIRIQDLVQKLNHLRGEDKNFSYPPLSESKIQEVDTKKSKQESKKENTVGPNSKKEIQTKTSEFIKVSTEKLDEVINYSSELSITKIQFENEFSAVNKLVKDWTKICERIQNQDLSVFFSKLEKSNKEFIDLYNSYARARGESPLDAKLIHQLKKLQNEIKSEIDGTELSLTEESILGLISLQEIRSGILRTLENLNLLTSRLQSGVMNFRMVPIASLFERFPSLIRDLARQCNKLVSVKIEGGDTELDRTIINHLADPMIHLLRNCVDHGIESEQERIANGKTPNGNIYLKAYYQGSYAVIEIKDDGRGISRDKIIEKAIQKGIIQYEDSHQLDDSEVYHFIFHPGFSTKDEVSELSGRGVGMDVVKSHIQALQGEVDIRSQIGIGTTILLRLPLTLAVVRVLIFEISGYILAFPMANVHEILTLNKNQLESIGSRVLFRYLGEYIPVIRLNSILEIPGNLFNNQELELIVLEEGGRKLGIIVDKLIGRQEIVIKNLGNILEKVPFIMGCTILSDRRIVLILNSKEIIDEGLSVTEKENRQFLESYHQVKHNILIVDDSSIHRQQLKTILVREGYHVDEAENGFEALKLVRFKSYRILCVDIVMPLMDGFELTRRLRSLPLYRSIPIFLITSSNTREDRDRGYKIGANEFFEKPINPDTIIEKVKYYIQKEDNG